VPGSDTAGTGCTSNATGKPFSSPLVRLYSSFIPIELLAEWAALASLTFKRNVRAECGKRDRYGREVCKVLDGLRDAGLEQISAGMAWWFHRYANEQSTEDRERSERAEQDATARKIGLWRDPNPVPPWEWRRR
jgi:endonuclease YncB( thermonuclease family)